MKPIKEKPIWKDVCIYAHRVSVGVCVCVSKSIPVILYFSVMCMNHRKPILDFCEIYWFTFLNPDEKNKAKIQIKHIYCKAYVR